MRKSLICIIIFVFTNILCQAQTWQWLKGANGLDYSEGTYLCVDANGNCFITGFYGGQTTFGSTTLQAAVSTADNIYLVKYDPNGNMLWAKNSIGATGSSDDVWSVCADGSGNSIITGRIGGTQIAFGTHTLINNGLQEFIVKYDPNGNVLWAKTSEGNSVGQGVSTDAAGNIYQTGMFNTTVAFDTFTLNANGTNIFLVKYDPNGNVVWAKNSVSSDFFNNECHSVSTDASGNSVITGAVSSATLGFGTHSVTTNNVQNIFTVKYDANGNALWAKTVNGSGPDVSRSVSTDFNGNIYITGDYASSPFIFGSSTLTTNGNAVFIAKYNANGNELWAVSATGTNIIGYSVASYSYGLFVSGSMDSGGTPITIGSNLLSPPTSYTDPCYIAQLDTNGNVVYAASLASGGDDWINVCVDHNCNAYLSGDFALSTFSVGSYTISQSGLENAFVAKLTYTCPDFTDVNKYSQSSSFSLYPNPNNGAFIIEIDNDNINSELLITNSLGQIITRQKMNKNENAVELTNIAPGIYFFIMEENMVRSASGKILIR